MCEGGEIGGKIWMPQRDNPAIVSSEKDENWINYDDNVRRRERSNRPSNYLSDSMAACSARNWFSLFSSLKSVINFLSFSRDRLENENVLKLSHHKRKSGYLQSTASSFFVISGGKDSRAHVGRFNSVKLPATILAATLTIDNTSSLLAHLEFKFFYGNFSSSRFVCFAHICDEH